MSNLNEYILNESNKVLCISSNFDSAYSAITEEAESVKQPEQFLWVQEELFQSELLWS